MIYDATLKPLLEKKFASFISSLEAFIYRQTTASLILVTLSALSLLISNVPWGTALPPAWSHKQAAFIIMLWLVATLFPHKVF